MIDFAVNQFHIIDVTLYYQFAFYMCLFVSIKNTLIIWNLRIYIKGTPFIINAKEQHSINVVRYHIEIETSG